jgi:hypothetical protein
VAYHIHHEGFSFEYEVRKSRGMVIGLLTWRKVGRQGPRYLELGEGQVGKKMGVIRVQEKHKGENQVEKQEKGCVMKEGEQNYGDVPQ